MDDVKNKQGYWKCSECGAVNSTCACRGGCSWIEQPQLKQDNGPWIVITELPGGHTSTTDIADLDAANEYVDWCKRRGIGTISTIIPVRQALASKALLDACRKMLPRVRHMYRQDKEDKAVISADIDLEAINLARNAIALTE